MLRRKSDQVKIKFNRALGDKLITDVMDRRSHPWIGNLSCFFPVSRIKYLYTPALLIYSQRSGPKFIQDLVKFPTNRQKLPNPARLLTLLSSFSSVYVGNLASFERKCRSCLQAIATSNPHIPSRTTIGGLEHVMSKNLTGVPI